MNKKVHLFFEQLLKLTKQLLQGSNKSKNKWFPLKPFSLTTTEDNYNIYISQNIQNFSSMTAFTSSQKGGNSQQIGEFWNDVFSTYSVKNVGLDYK